MIVQVVPGQIGKNPRFKGAVPGPSLIQGMGGDLHDDIRGAPVRHPTKLPHEIKGFRCRDGGGFNFSGDPVVDGADHTRPSPGRRKDGLQQVAYGRFAVCSGNPDHQHVPVRMTEKSARHFCEGLSGVLYADRSDLCVKPSDRLLHHQGRRPSFKGVSDKVVSVKDMAPHGHEKVSRFDLPGVIGQPRDLQFRIPREIIFFDVIKQMAEFHRHSDDLLLIHIKKSKTADS